MLNSHTRDASCIPVRLTVRDCCVLAWVGRARDHGGGVLLLVGLQDGVKDRVGKDVLAVIQVIISGEFSVDVVALYCVEICPFLLVVEDLHRIVYGAKGVCLF